MRNIKTEAIRRIMMIVVSSLLLMSCGTKPAIIRINETEDTPSVTPEARNGLERFAEQASVEESTSPTKIFVHVCGAVNQPGVYEMIEGDRVFEAIELADGFTEEAHQQSVNLADKVIDGQQVIVPTAEEATMMPRAETVAGTQAGQRLININTADATMLQELSGIGEAKAKGILSYRENNGLFSSIEDIKNVSGIGAKLYEKIKENITVD